MKREDLLELKKFLSELSEEELKERDAYLQKLANGTYQGPPVGYPDLDKPWLKHYGEEALDYGNTNMSTTKFLKECNKHLLHKVAIEYFKFNITYKELFRRIDNASKAFLEMGVKPGDIVTLSLPNIPENLVAMYALNQIGAVANMIDLRLKEDKLVSTINKCNSKLIITSDLFLDNFAEVKDQTTIEKVVVASVLDSIPKVFKPVAKKKMAKEGVVVPEVTGLDYMTWDEFYKIGKNSKKEINDTFGNDDVMVIHHTSGTTGDSKGVVLTNRCFNTMAEHLHHCGFDIQNGDRFFNQAPPFLVFNTLVASHFPLTRGVVLVMNPEYRPDIFYDNIYKHKINHSIAGPADYNSFTEHPEARGRDYRRVKTLVSGSDKINEEKKDECDDILAEGGSVCKVTEGYGMTEVGAAAVTNLPQINVRGSVGIPLPATNVCIYDNDNGTELGYNQVGEICFSGPTLMQGYLNNPEETENALRNHGDFTWMHSGDLGYIDENGAVFLKGRLKRVVVNYQGFKISPLDLERIIDTHPVVNNCCVIGANDTEHGFGQIPVAVIVPNTELLGDHEEFKEEIMGYCKEQLSDKYIPKDIVLADELPLTPVGKVDYRALTEKYNNGGFVKRR